MFYILVTNAFLLNISAFSAVTVCLTYVLFGQVHDLQTQNLPFKLVRVGPSAKRLGNLGVVMQSWLEIERSHLAASVD